MRKLFLAYSLPCFLLFCFLITTGADCTGTIFPVVGNHLAAPISVAVDVARSRAYVVNSNDRVEFDGATLSVLDITSPTAPALASVSGNPIALDDFSGQIYLDATNQLAYTPNRLSSNTTDTVDALLKINLNEASSFATITSASSGNNPFGIACCDASDRIYTISSGGTVEVYNKSDLSFTQVSLAITLAEGSVSGASATEVVLGTGGTQAFVTNRAGRIYVLNTAEIGDTSKNPIDYVIKNVGDARGIAFSTPNLYVVDGTGGTPVLRVINTSTLTLISPDISSISEVDVSTVQSTTVALGSDPNEIVIHNAKAYVSNRGDDTLSVIDLASLSTAPTTITVGDEPFGLAAFTSGTDNFLYVTNLASNSLSIVNLATNTVVATFTP